MSSFVLIWSNTHFFFLVLERDDFWQNMQVIWWDTGDQDVNKHGLGCFFCTSSLSPCWVCEGFFSVQTYWNYCSTTVWSQSSWFPLCIQFKNNNPLCYKIEVLKKIGSFNTSAFVNSIKLSFYILTLMKIVFWGVFLTWFLWYFIHDGGQIWRKCNLHLHFWV